MKKFFLIAASAMMVLASCTKVVINYPEDAQPQEIAMFAVNKSATKAPVGGADEGGTFPTDYNMMVAAYLAAGAQSNGDYFDGTLFTKVTEGTNNLWTGSKYWPVSESTINFLAVAQPSDNDTYTGEVSSVVFGEKKEGANENSKFTKKAVVTFVHNQTTDDKYNQFDLMYAAGQGTYEGQGSYTPVNMAFKHALSWIKFTVATNVQNKEDENTYSMTVNSIRLSGASYGGTMTLALGKETNEDDQKVDIEIEDANETSDYTCNWSDQSEGVVDVYVPGAPVTNEDGDVTVSKATAVAGLAAYEATAQPFGNGLLVVPDNYLDEEDGSRPTITINYTMNQGNGDYTFEKTIEIPQINWEANKIYTYALTITLQKIEINPSVEKWDDTDENGTPETTDDVNWGAEVPLS